MRLTADASQHNQEDRDWLARFITVALPETVDSYDLGAILYNALHETDLDRMRAHVKELADLLGYSGTPEA